MNWFFFQDCNKCTGIINGTKSCFSACESRGLLNSCLNHPNPDVNQIIHCCGFARNSDCGNQLTNADNCLTDCLDPCVVTTALDYASCFAKHNGEKNCNRDTCYSNLRSQFNLPNVTTFDYKAITDKINKLHENDLENCNKIDTTVKDVCNIGKSCCNPFDTYLGDVLSCVFNDVVLKIYGENHYHNASYLPGCSIACRGRRFLDDQAVDMTPRFIGGAELWIDNHDRSLQISANGTNITACTEELKVEYIATDGNTTTALGAYLSCVVTTVTSDVAVANSTATMTTQTAGVRSYQIARGFATVLLVAVLLL